MIAKHSFSNEIFTRGETNTALSPLHLREKGKRSQVNRGQVWGKNQDRVHA